LRVRQCVDPGHGPHLRRPRRHHRTRYRLRLPRRPRHHRPQEGRVRHVPGRGLSRGEVMPIDPQVALGAELPSKEFSWTASDIALYHLGIGAGHRWTDPAELRYLDDREPQVLPTFATVAHTLRDTDPPKVKFPGVDIALPH